MKIRANCPRCMTKMMLTAAGSVCGGCGLEVAARWRDTKCSRCSYSLDALESDACPECGKSVPYRMAAVGPIAWEYAWAPEGVPEDAPGVVLPVVPGGDT
jgi:predicted amidophosphoribosyltransferase